MTTTAERPGDTASDTGDELGGPLLREARAALRRRLPGLADWAASTTLAEREARGNDGLAQFRAAGGCRLIVPEEISGAGVGAVEALAVQRAVGAVSPSLAVATVMHHLSIATIVQIAQEGPEEDLALLQSVVEQDSLIASAFAEGRVGGSTLVPTVSAVYDDETGDYVVTGSKKPCSMAHSMTFLAASLDAKETEGGRGRKAVGLIPAQMPGISVRPFWTSPVLAGAESEEVVLDGVRVPAALMMIGTMQDPDGVHEMTGFLWFGLLATAGYIGAASTLVDRVLHHPRADPAVYTPLAAELETGMAALTAVAAAYDAGDRGPELSARLLFIRTAVRTALQRVASGAMTALGGLSFITDPDVAYLGSVLQAFSFHPPSIAETQRSLFDHHRGGEFRLS
ncbi:acyl-CoA dehydrogenase family protein [Williamsia deligens]|uniref:Acyl-CoA dehydrogenase family protein n=1 Tax=Williamsia deligens TaxID=321325 RepID=A0ABW3G5B5_9NOCA|nr:acyl-CoA dehydrogenase family protein [Williamsia deligens]MCP2193969.1 Acyl-CoA dehydrogenase [Williamsia deligens]